MSNLFNSMRIGYTGFIEDGQYLMLFMAALLLLWISEDPRKREFTKFCLVMLLVLLFPLTAKLLIVYQTAFYNYENLWELLPVTTLLSYGLVIAFIRMTASIKKEYGHFKSIIPKRKEITDQLFIGAVLVVFLFLCGTLSLGKTMSAPSFDSTRMPIEVKAVLDQIPISEEEEVYLLAPDSIMTWARIYNGNIHLPYGRNLVEPKLSAYTYDVYSEDMWLLHDWVNGNLPACVNLQEAVWQEEMYLSQCASNGYDYLVFSDDRHDSEILAQALSLQKEYTLFAEVENYVIYILQ